MLQCFLSMFEMFPNLAGSGHLTQNKLTSMIFVTHPREDPSAPKADRPSEKMPDEHGGKNPGPLQIAGEIQ